MSSSNLRTLFLVRDGLSTVQVKENTCVEGGTWAQVLLLELSVFIPSWLSSPCSLLPRAVHQCVGLFIMSPSFLAGQLDRRHMDKVRCLPDIGCTGLFSLCS